jgi:hypothetical protein
MPEINNNSKFWFRGGKLNQKRHFELSETEKANIALCKGIKNGHPCKNPIFRCSECGNYGCDQEVADKCDAQAFKNGKCLQCGAVGSQIPVMKDELEKYVAEWEKKSM